jgi:hypothetical protein
MNYTIQPSETLIPEAGNLRECFTKLITAGVFTRWELYMRDNTIISGFTTASNVNLTPTFETTYAVDMLVALLRYASQTSKFLYNVRELQLYTDQHAPLYIIRRPILSTTSLLTRKSGRYDEISHLDVNRPEPDVTTMNP